ncbi:hypothetical protein J6590_050902 [Homalodisca vitripennis]|nr:hypothetical protein J6590_050902 [Homalodisca vitripennis]
MREDHSHVLARTAGSHQPHGNTATSLGAYVIPTCSEVHSHVLARTAGSHQPHGCYIQVLLHNTFIPRRLCHTNISEDHSHVLAEQLISSAT